jgi:hypothetical protein
LVVSSSVVSRSIAVKSRTLRPIRPSRATAPPEHAERGPVSAHSVAAITSAPPGGRRPIRRP